MRCIVSWRGCSSSGVERDLLLQPIRKHKHRVRGPHARDLFKQCALRADLECVQRPDALRRRLLFDGNAHPAHVQNVVGTGDETEPLAPQRGRPEARGQAPQ
jgi:hypothetical protein